MDSLLTASFIARTGALLVLSLCTFSTAHGALHITEFMADNGDSNLDGDAFDWIGFSMQGRMPTTSMAPQRSTSALLVELPKGKARTLSGCAATNAKSNLG